MSNYRQGVKVHSIGTLLRSMDIFRDSFLGIVLPVFHCGIFSRFFEKIEKHPRFAEFYLLEFEYLRVPSPAAHGSR
jgi:hypothetical protein